MAVVLGLGNPGAAYSRTRHNIGFMVLDHLARELGAPEWKRRLKSRVTEIGGILLVKPETYMNLSGDAALDVQRALSVPASQFIVVFDDMDLEVGRIRIRKKGSSAGHKGMQSIIERLGTDEISRVRVGIGRPEPGQDAAEYVLRRPVGDERERLEKAIANAARAVLVILEQGVETAMTMYNGSTAKASVSP